MLAVLLSARGRSKTFVNAFEELSSACSEDSSVPLSMLLYRRQWQKLSIKRKRTQANCCADHCSPYSASHSHICPVCIRWCCDRFRPKWIYTQLQSCTRLPSCPHLHRHSGILLCVVLKNTEPTVMYWRLLWFNSVLGVLKECKLRWHFGSGSVEWMLNCFSTVFRLFGLFSARPRTFSLL